MADREVQRRALFMALLPDPAQRDLYELNPEFHAFVRATLDTLPTLIEFAAASAGTFDLQRAAMQRAMERPLFTMPEDYRGPV